MFYISLRLSILPRPNYHFHQANVYKHPHLCTALLSSFIICTNLRYIFNLFYPLYFTYLHFELQIRTAFSHYIIQSFNSSIVSRGLRSQHTLRYALANMSRINRRDTVVSHKIGIKKSFITFLRVTKVIDYLRSDERRCSDSAKILETYYQK